MLVGGMGSLNLTIQLRCSALNRGMADALVLEIPVKLGLELMAVIGSDLCHAEREFIDDVIDEVLSCSLVVDFECSDARSVVNGVISKPTDFFATLAYEGY